MDTGTADESAHRIFGAEVWGIQRAEWGCRGVASPCLSLNVRARGSKGCRPGSFARSPGKWETVEELGRRTAPTPALALLPAPLRCSCGLDDLCRGSSWCGGRRGTCFWDGLIREVGLPFLLITR